MMSVTVTKGQKVLIGNNVLLLKLIDFNSSRSFIAYELFKEDGSISNQSVLHCGEKAQLLPDVTLSLVRMTNRSEPHVDMEFDTRVDVSIKEE